MGDWNVQAASLIDSIGTDTFPEILTSILQSTVDFDFSVIFGYIGKEIPLALFDNFSPDRRIMHVEDYLEGPYLLDPFFLAAVGNVPAGVWRLSEIAPDRFFQGEYFRSYYSRTGLAEEVGLLINVSDRLTVIVSLMRDARRFTKVELKALKSIWPVIDATCRRHWKQMVNDLQISPNNSPTDIEKTFRKIGQGVLTPREREVVELTLRGHSADALGTLLGISPGTVRIHRKNIYAKLRIGSQGELFSLFISALSQLPSAVENHPV